jgi:hypothetical protein
LLLAAVTLVVWLFWAVGFVYASAAADSRPSTSPPIDPEELACPRDPSDL